MIDLGRSIIYGFTHNQISKMNSSHFNIAKVHHRLDFLTHPRLINREQISPKIISFEPLSRDDNHVEWGSQTQENPGIFEDSRTAIKS